MQLEFPWELDTRVWARAMSTVSLSKCLHVHVVKREPLLRNKTFQEDIILLQSSLHNRR